MLQAVAALRRAFARAFYFFAITLGAAIAIPGHAATAIEVAGIQVDDAIHLHGEPLRLNGAGVRYKAAFKVYVAALYLGAKADATEDVLALPGPKRIALTMLRDIDANELGKLLTRGVEDNSARARMSPLIPGLLRMSQIFSDHKALKTGDTLTLDWIPGEGTAITIKGAAHGLIKEREFFDALLRIWLGPVPADWRLKEALLGKG